MFGIDPEIAQHHIDTHAHMVPIKQKLRCMRTKWTRILYPLRLGPLFPINVGILKPKVGLKPDQIEIDLGKVFSEKYNSFMN